MYVFEKIINARDLGGIAIDGKTVRKGLLLRSGNLYSATEADIARLRDEFKLKRIFDFRTYPESRMQPDKTIPGAEYLLLPTLDQAAEKATGEAIPEEIWLDLSRHILQLAFMRQFQEKGRELYPSLVMSEYSQLQYATFLNLILETEGGAVLWHCSQGKDRTGIGAALLLAALGASEETIIQDFALSNITYASQVNLLVKKIMEMGGGEEEMDVIRAFMGVSVRNFRRALALVRSNWGSMDSYLETRMGIGKREREILRSKYLQ